MTSFYRFFLMERFASHTRANLARFLVLALVTLPLASCLFSDDGRFSPASMGVSASPKIGSSGTMPKGGGFRSVGKPYKINGKWYYPRNDPSYNKVGNASWYGDAFHGRLTANGELFDMNTLSAAHTTLPLPSYVEVTNLDNGYSLTVRVNDRGPFARNRIIDLSRRAATLLRFRNRGTANVRVRYLGPASIAGSDDRKLLASLKHNGVPVGPRTVQVASRGVPKAQITARSLTLANRSSAKRNTESTKFSNNTYGTLLSATPKSRPKETPWSQLPKLRFLSNRDRSETIAPARTKEIAALEALPARRPNTSTDGVSSTLSVLRIPKPRTGRETSQTKGSFRVVVARFNNHEVAVNILRALPADLGKGQITRLGSHAQIEFIGFASPALAERTLRSVQQLGFVNAVIEENL